MLQPNDPDSYYASRELVPSDMLDDVNRAKIVITNYHAFKLRERIELSKGGRLLLQGRSGEELNTLETEGQMLQRVMPDLMGMKNILVLNDEAHHCYREKPQSEDEEGLKGDDRKEAEKNNEAARLWISGLEAVNRKLGVARVIDLSATPFFLRGSGYAEGTLFPWTMSDFSLMDAIECGIVKLPRVPVAENIPGDEMPMFRNLWENIRKDMPKKGRGKARNSTRSTLPTRLQTALQALYGHYEKTFKLWEKAGVSVPPCFIIVCQNTVDLEAGLRLHLRLPPEERRRHDDAGERPPRSVPQFRRDTGNPLPAPEHAAHRQRAARSGRRARRQLSRHGGRRDRALPPRDRRSAPATQRARRQHHRPGTAARGHEHRRQARPARRGHPLRRLRLDAHRGLGRQHRHPRPRHPRLRHPAPLRAGHRPRAAPPVLRPERRKGCSTSNTPTCFGIPFDFTAKPVVAPPQPPRETVQVKAVRPERDALEIRFPRVEGYRVELPEERLTAEFNDDSILELSPDLVGPSITRNSGHHRRRRGPEPGAPGRHAAVHAPLPPHPAAALHEVARPRRGAEAPPLRSAQAHHQAVARHVPRLQGRHLSRAAHVPGTGRHGLQPHHGGHHAAFDGRAAHQGAARSVQPDRLHSARPLQHVQAPTAGKPAPTRCHVNWVVLDSDWEAEFCRVAESHPQVRAYVKNHNLGLEVPYRYGSETRKYLPDFIVLVDDGHGADDLLHLVVEIKGYRREDAKEKKSTMDTYWVPGVNHLGTLRPLGVRRVHRGLPDRGRLQGQGRERVQQDDRQSIATAGRTGLSK